MVLGGVGALRRRALLRAPQDAALSVLPRTPSRAARRSWPWCSVPTRIVQRFHQDVAAVVEKLRSPGLNSRDAARRQRGYYEKLNDVGWENPELSKVYMVRPADWGSTPIPARSGEVQRGIAVPGSASQCATGDTGGAEVQFNRWGMRDRDYPLEPAAGVYRIALLGASHTFASGVKQEQGFESLIEDRLNREDRLGRLRTRARS